MNKLYEESLVKRIKSELAKELHDEIGSALAVISSRIKLAKLKLEQEDKLSPEYFDNAEKQADSLLKSTRDFIWTVASSDEDPRNVFYYLKDFGEELFEDSSVEFTTDFYDKITGTVGAAGASASWSIGRRPSAAISPNAAKRAPSR